MRTTQLRAAVSSLLLIVLSGCTGRAIDAGEEGGFAFIALAGMLVLTGVLMWWFLGRND